MIFTTTATTIIPTTKINDAVTKLDLESYNSCEIWLEGYNSAATKSVYKVHLSLFCKYHKIYSIYSSIIIFER